jgi:hypothetical protein
LCLSDRSGMAGGASGELSALPAEAPLPPPPLAELTCFPSPDPSPRQRRSWPAAPASCIAPSSTAFQPPSSSAGSPALSPLPPDCCSPC